MGENKKDMVIDMAENSDMKTDALQQVSLKRYGVNMIQSVDK